MTLPIATFELHRTEDASGVSGTGVVAQGALFANGWCVVAWQTQHNSVCVYRDIQDAIAIHGHGGKTQFKVTYTNDMPEIASIISRASVNREVTVETKVAPVKPPDHVDINVTLPMVASVASPADEEADADASQPPDVAGIVSAVTAYPWTQKWAPTGKPGIALFLQTLLWLRADKTRSEKMEKAFWPNAAKPGSVAKMAGTSEVIDQMGRLPVSDSMRWMLTVSGVKADDIWTAYQQADFLPLCARLVEFGFGESTPMSGTDAWRTAHMNKNIAAIIAGTRNDREYTDHGPVLEGAVAVVMNALRHCSDAITPEQRAKMADHLMRTFDGDRAAAWKPLEKLSAKLGSLGALGQIQTLVSRGDLPVAVLAKCFVGEWTNLYRVIAGKFVDMTKPEWVST